MSNEIMAVLAVCCVLLVTGSAVYKLWTLGSNEDDYEIICLGGHEYWRANFAAKGFLAVKLLDNGQPSKCKPISGSK
jgi:hypothetical protein